MTDRAENPVTTVFSFGFRPFFLLAAVWAIIPTTMLWWMIDSSTWPPSAPPLFSWHGHEMIFGFGVAAIAGFLLTAVPRWTGTKQVSGFPLALLVLLWISGRATSSPFWLPDNLTAQLLTVAFIPALVLTIGHALVRAKATRNFPILLLLVVLFFADLIFQAARFGWIDDRSTDPLQLAVNTILLLVVIIGGRIIPSFTKTAISEQSGAGAIRSFNWLDIATVAGAIVVLVGDILVPGTKVAGFLAGIAAVLLGARFSGWRTLHTLRKPLLWVLHIGYSWVIVGLALKAAWLITGYEWSANWLHAITTGAFGTMILAVTTRAALGHTGRPLIAPRPIVASYALVTLAAIIRVWGPWMFSDHYWAVLFLAVFLWVAAYTIFLIIYAPMLVKPAVT